MTHSNVPRPLCLGTALLCLALATVVGCGPNASPPEPPVIDDATPPKAEPQKEPVVEPDAESAMEPEAEPATSPEEEPDEETVVGRTDSEPETFEPGDVDGPPLDEPTVDEPIGDEPPIVESALEPAGEPFERPEPEPVRDLGPPLVENVGELKKLDQEKPVWLDAKNHRIVMVGQVCLREGGLELFACLKDTKEHESVLTVDVKAVTVHAGLLASGAMVGSPVRFDPMYVPAQGTEIEVTLAWKNEKGELATARAQDWLLDAETNEPMTHPWVFAGSGFWVDDQTGKRHYMAEGGDFICVSNFTTAMLDLPIESSQANSALMYQALTDAIPPLGTPVTLILTPKIEAPKQEAKPAQEEASPKETDPPAVESNEEVQPNEEAESHEPAESDES